MNVSISKDELLQSKRATVVLAECFKVSMGGKQAPPQMRQDMQTLLKLLRKLEAIAQ